VGGILGDGWGAGDGGGCGLRECGWGWMVGVDMLDEMTELDEALDDGVTVMMVWILYE